MKTKEQVGNCIFVAQNTFLELNCGLLESIYRKGSKLYRSNVFMNLYHAQLILTHALFLLFL